MDEHELADADPCPADLGASAPGNSDFDEWCAWFDREVEAGRDPTPPERATEGISISLGDAVDMDPGLLAAMCGPDGLGGEGLGAQFAQDAEADALSPSPVLSALTEASVADVTRLTDDQLIGVLQAARRQENREAWKKTLVIAEFARRRTAAFNAAEARGVPVHCRPGQFPGEELAMELLVGPIQVSHVIDDATDLATRLPRTLAGMAAGLIDEGRAGVIALYTRNLAPADAAIADEVLAALAPTVRLDRLAYKAAALEKKLDPVAARARREHARRTRQRVEVRREESGNASVAGREMDNGEALASKAHIHALALRLRRAGMPGTLDQLRLLVFADLTTGRNPLDRLTRPDAESEPTGPASPRRQPPPPRPASQDQPTPADPADADNPADGRNGADPDNPTVAARPPDTAGPADPAAQDSPADAAGPAGPAGRDSPAPTGERDTRMPDYGDDDSGYGRDEDERGDDHAVPAIEGRPPTPMPAAINLVVHAGTLFGWDATPSEAGGWGLLDGDQTRTIVAAASRHPATRWCVTVIGRGGTALAHGCSPGRHPWTPGIQPGTGPPKTADPRAPTGIQAAQFGDFLRRLKVTLAPVASDGCDHAAAEARYTPSRRLAHLVRARTATCDAPGCAAQAAHADLDHTIPYPEGQTDQCNLGPRCKR